MSSNATRPNDTDAIYYRHGVTNSVAMGMLRCARAEMFKLFMDQMKPGPATRIIDVGTSEEENEGANFLEKEYPWRHKLTCAGIGSGEAVCAAYPQVSFTHIEPGEKLPFETATFDIACSNAVLEHVGGKQQRREFLLELLRVASAVFITVPNRWFPVEHHTSIPLLHFSPSAFRRALRGTRLDYWSHTENVDFLDRPLLLSEWPTETPPTVFYTGLTLGVFSSNLAIVYKRPLAP